MATTEEDYIFGKQWTAAPGAGSTVRGQWFVGYLVPELGDNDPTAFTWVHQYGAERNEAIARRIASEHNANRALLAASKNVLSAIYSGALMRRIGLVPEAYERLNRDCDALEAAVALAETTPHPEAQ